MKFFTVLADNVTSYLTKPKNHGYMIEENTRSFLFSFENDTRTFQQALLACCSVGMKLLSLHQADKYKAVQDALTIAKQLPAMFWTSGTALGCKGNFGYCSTNRLLREEAKWEIGQGNDFSKNEDCLAINIQQSALLWDENCDSKKRYICEGRLASGAKVVEAECGNAFRLTADEIKNLMVKIPERLEEKCFLKCFGDGTNMFVNGRLVEENIYAQFTSVAAGDMKKLMEMYSTMSYCVSSAKGMDPCDKASQLLTCGKDNSPNLVVGLMNNLENAITEAPVILPPSKGICPEFNCIVDDVLKPNFDNAANGSCLFLQNSFVRGHVSHVCGQRFFSIELKEPVSLKGAMEWCCKFGLRLLTVATASKMQCLKQIDFNGCLYGNQNFLVAASRMGKIQNPVWCFSQVPFYPLPGIDNTKTNDTNSIDVRVEYLGSKFDVCIDSYRHLACETF